MRPQVVAGLIASALILIAVGILTYAILPPRPRSSDNTDNPFIDETSGAGTAGIAGGPPAPVGAAAGPNEPTVASITPAGTDLILGIGAGDHLVAVSDLDEDRDGTEGLPRVGDFDHVDWEKLTAVRPAVEVLITQFGSRMPAGLTDRCAQLNIRVIDLKLDVIEDVFSEADALGKALGEEGKAQQAVADLKRELTDIAKDSARFPPVRVAVAVSDGGSVGLIGPGTFHDELLTLVGGVNVAAGFKKPYIAADREQIAALQPQVVLDMEPVPPSTPQQMRQAARFWASLPDLPAVQSHNVKTVFAPYCLRPGWHLAELARIFAADLHGKP